MATIAFDSHKIIRKLKNAGFSEDQAEALTDALRSTIDNADFVTRKDLQIDLAPLKSDLAVIKWMLGPTFGLILGGIAALILKTFF
ncbi:DUF1640 domain-containing protein [Desulfonatronum thioautotrophicum]|uniref:DUF1640 domain-containing protein n=1 Tax=Desulfonatronum thioautotrophicum TaxID=617001 RepID=UPI0005EB1DA8|nr:DUF1640 domain-containing protein [Desulfonatronum thioautotrophicum]